MTRSAYRLTDVSARLYGSFALVLGLLLLFVTFSHLNFQRLVAADRLNVHTYKVLLTAHQVSRSLENINAGMRGFLISGNPGFLRFYQNARDDFEARFDALQHLTSDRKIQQDRLRNLRIRHKAWLQSEIEPLIVSRRIMRDNTQGLRFVGADTGAAVR